MKSTSCRSCKPTVCVVASVIFWLALLMVLPLPSTASSTKYAIQIGVFEQLNNALELVSRQNQKGGAAFYREERLKDGNLRYKVYLGNYQTQKAAKKAAQALKRKKAILATAFVSPIVGDLPKTDPAREPAVQTATATDTTTDAMITERKSESLATSAPSAQTVPPTTSALPPEPTVAAPAPVEKPKSTVMAEAMTVPAVQEAPPVTPSKAAEPDMTAPVPETPPALSRPTDGYRIPSRDSLRQGLLSPHGQGVSPHR